MQETLEKKPALKEEQSVEQKNNNPRTVNLVEELNEIKEEQPDTLLDELHRTLEKEEEHDVDAVRRVFGGEHSSIVRPASKQAKKNSDAYDRFLAETQNEGYSIYTHEHIRNLCVDYRLRFRPSNEFKGYVPSNTASKIRRFEKYLLEKFDVKSKDEEKFLGQLQWAIVAPTSQFSPQPKRIDPLLFVRVPNGAKIRDFHNNDFRDESEKEMNEGVGDIGPNIMGVRRRKRFDREIDGDHYILVDQWGGEINARRKTMAWFLRSPSHVFFMVFGIALASTCLLGLFAASGIECFLGFQAFGVIIGLIFGGNMVGIATSRNWNWPRQKLM